MRPDLPKRLADPPTSRYAFALEAVQTAVEGRVTGAHILAMVEGYKTLHRDSGNWLILAEKATSYGTDAIQEAVVRFAELHSQFGLKKIYAVLTAPTVRMGASVVSMGLRAAGSPVEILVYATLEEAVGALRDRK